MAQSNCLPFLSFYGQSPWIHCSKVFFSLHHPAASHLSEPPPPPRVMSKERSPPNPTPPPHTQSKDCLLKQRSELLLIFLTHALEVLWVCVLYGYYTGTSIHSFNRFSLSAWYVHALGRQEWRKQEKPLPWWSLHDRGGDRQQTSGTISKQDRLIDWSTYLLVYARGQKCRWRKTKQERRIKV